MSFYDPNDEIPQRHPSEMSVIVNTIGTIGAKEEYEEAFLVAHVSDHENSKPSVLLSLWLSETEEHGDQLEYTTTMTAQQARALAFGMLRIADGLEAMVAAGEYGEGVEIIDIPVYYLEPEL